MLERVKDSFGSMKDSTACYAHRVGRKTSALARRVGPRRGGIALGVIAAAVGVPLLVRYLRSRRADAERQREIDENEAEILVVTEVSPIPASAPIGPSLA